MPILSKMGCNWKILKCFSGKNHYSFIWRQNPPYKCDYYSVNWCFDKVSSSNFTEVEIWLKNAVYGAFFALKWRKMTFFIKLCQIMLKYILFSPQIAIKFFSDNLGHNTLHFCRISAKKCKPQVNGSCFNRLKSYQL